MEHITNKAKLVPGKALNGLIAEIKMQRYTNSGFLKSSTRKNKIAATAVSVNSGCIEPC